MHDHGHGLDLEALTGSTFLSTWQFRPGWTIAALLLIGVYVALWARARQRSGPVHVGHLVSWVMGVGLIVYTMSSAIDAYAMTLFWIHMTEHLMLIMVIPLFLVLGSPLKVTRSALGSAGQDRFDGLILRSPLALIFHPFVGLAIYSIVIVATHLTGFMDDMAMDMDLMLFEQILYIVTGWIYFTSMMADEPTRWRFPTLGRIALSVIGMTPDTVVGIVILQSSHNMYPMYMVMRPDWAPDPLRDQYWGGAMMWGVGDGLMMLFGLILMLQLILSPKREGGFGAWLEGARTSTFSEHVGKAGEDYVGRAQDASIDDDEAALEAYNRMLRKLNEHA